MHVVHTGGGGGRHARTHTHTHTHTEAHTKLYSYFLFYFSESQLDFVLERDLTLTFDNTSRRQCFDVRIIADQDDDESEEFFSLVLSLIQFFPGLSIDLTRDTALITILPNITPPRKLHIAILPSCMFCQYSQTRA